MVCLNNSIQRPGLGVLLNNAGIAVNIANGAAIPIPITIIASVARPSGCACAQANAAANIAKLHGVLSIAAKNPIPTAPPNPFPEPLLPDIDEGTVIVNRPNINNASTTISIAIPATNAGVAELVAPLKGGVVNEFQNDICPGQTREEKQ